MYMDGWDIALMLVATYFAIMILVRLMRKRRDDLVANMRGQIEQEQKRRAALAKQENEESDAA